MKPSICPSLLSSDLSKLAIECNQMLKYGADRLHLDVMDGHFVPNLTFGAPVIKWIRKNVTGFLDVHLMIENPGRWVDSYIDAGADNISFHVEAVSNKEEILKILNAIKSKKVRSCLAIKPKTPVPEYIFEFISLKLLDMVLIMTVEPGFGGQKFMKDQLSKIQLIREKAGDEFDIQVDGGINEVTIEMAAKAGANVMVSGSTIFKSSDPKDLMTRFRKIVESSFSGSKK